MYWYSRFKTHNRNAYPKIKRSKEQYQPKRVIQITMNSDRKYFHAINFFIGDIIF